MGLNQLPRVSLLVLLLLSFFNQTSGAAIPTQVLHYSDAALDAWPSSQQSWRPGPTASFLPRQVAPGDLAVPQNSYSQTTLLTKSYNQTAGSVSKYLSNRTLSKSPIQVVAASKEASALPQQLHHFATNKHSFFTPQMEKIASEFGLKLDGAWNKELMPHLGRHPTAYHNFVLEGMQKAQAGAGGNQAAFIKLFDQYVKQPVLQNADLLRKIGWE